MKNHKNGNEFGRSMIEMLGVLTIVGLLSVIGIYGYNRAMQQLALNRQGQEVSDFFSGLTAYTSKTIRSTFTSTSSFVSGFEQLGYLPDSLQKSTSANTYIDYLGNSVIIVQLEGTATINIRWFYRTPEQFVNIAKNIQRFSQNISSIDLLSTATTYVGDRDCTSSKRCLNAVTLSDWQTLGNTYTSGSIRIYFYRR
jgi:type II secretory pathway pseudopilin PulG